MVWMHGVTAVLNKLTRKVFMYSFTWTRLLFPNLLIFRLPEQCLWPRSSSLPSEVCSVDCGTHGVCMGGACRCEEGWTGASCDQRVCNPVCIKHGTCKDGKCQCHQGWNGEHCTIGKRPHVCVNWRCVCGHRKPSQNKLAAPLHFVKRNLEKYRQKGTF